MNHSRQFLSRFWLPVLVVAAITTLWSITSEGSEQPRAASLASAKVRVVVLEGTPYQHIFCSSTSLQNYKQVYTNSRKTL